MPLPLHLPFLWSVLRLTFCNLTYNEIIEHFKFYINCNYEYDFACK